MKKQITAGTALFFVLLMGCIDQKPGSAPESFHIPFGSIQDTSGKDTTDKTIPNQPISTWCEKDTLVQVISGFAQSYHNSQDSITWLRVWLTAFQADCANIKLKTGNRFVRVEFPDFSVKKYQSGDIEILMGRFIFDGVPSGYNIQAAKAGITFFDSAVVCRVKGYLTAEEWYGFDYEDHFSINGTFDVQFCK